MAGNSEHDIVCGGCDTPLEQPANLPVEDRVPCPNCGSLARRIYATCTSTLSLSAKLKTELIPGIQERDWHQRFREMQLHFERLLAPRSGPMSAQIIQTANHELQSFFIQAYHLKDSLIQDSQTTGISKSVIETTITQDHHLALLADLANLDKHNSLTKTPRSGDLPSWRVSGVDADGGGWQISLKIQHQGNTIDGLTFAGQAMLAWERHLRQWGLI